MPVDLFTVRRVDAWPTQKPGVTLFLIRGETVSDTPVPYTLKTCKPLHAAACERAKQTQTYVWVTWKDARGLERDLVQVELDDSKWTPDAEATV